MIARRQITTLIFILILCGGAFPQSEYVAFIPGAQAVGLGGSLVGGAYNPFAVYWNPAALAFVRSQKLVLNIDAPYQLNYTAFSQFIPHYGTFGGAFSLPHRLNDSLSTTSAAWGKSFQNTTAIGLNLNLHHLNQTTQSTFGLSAFYRVPANHALLQSFPAFSQILHDGSLSFAGTLLNLPISNSHIKHSIRLGMRYENTGTGVIFNTAVHLQQPQASFHLGFGARFTSRFSIYAGIQDFNPNTVACGFRLQDTNYAIDWVYSNQTQALQVAMEITLGQNERQLAKQYTIKAKKTLQNGNYRKALLEYQNATLYSVGNDSIQALINYLQKKQQNEDRIIDSLYYQASKDIYQRKYITAAYNYLKILQINPYSQKAKENLKLIKPHIDIFIDRIYQRAVNEFEQGELKNALTTFKAILVIRDNHQGAKQYFEQITDSLHIQAQDHYYSAWGFEKENNLQRAKREYEIAREYDPESKQIQQRYQNLLERIQRNKKQRDRQIQTYLQRAHQYKRKKNSVSAFRFYKKVLNLEPHNPEAQAGLELMRADVVAYSKKRYNNAKKLLNQGHLSQAEKAFKDVKSVASLDPQLQFYYRESYLFINKISARRKTECNQLYEAGQRFLQNKNWEAALVQFEKMMMLKCDKENANQKYQETLSIIGVDSLAERGKRYFANGEYRDAMNCFQKVLKTRPNDREALGNIEKCQTELNKVVEENFNLGMSYFTEENYQEALNLWQEVLKFNPNHQDTIEYIKRAKKRIEALKRLR